MLLLTFGSTLVPPGLQASDRFTFFKLDGHGGRNLLGDYADGDNAHGAAANGALCQTATAG